MTPAEVVEMTLTTVADGMEYIIPIAGVMAGVTFLVRTILNVMFHNGKDIV